MRLSMGNILFLIGNINNTGGTERATTIIANELSSNGYKVSILSLTGGDEPFFKLNDNISTYSLYSKIISFKKHYIRTVLKIKHFCKRQRFDTVIVVDSISCIFTVPALWGLSVNHICWEHFNFNNNNGVKLREIGRYLAARHCNYIVTLTNRDKVLWTEGLKTITAEIVTIANPTPYENFPHTSSIDYKTVLAVGRLTHVKGFDLLIKAWSYVCEFNDDWVLRIVGSGEEEVELKSKVKELGLYDRIVFLPATKDIEKHYQTSSFYCLSSRFEGFGMVIVEAQSFGLPVISFDCDCGPRDLIKDNIDGFLVENGNVRDLAIRILMCIDLEKDKYLKLSDNSRLSASRFSVSNIVNDWYDIL